MNKNSAAKSSYTANSKEVMVASGRAYLATWFESLKMGHSTTKTIYSTTKGSLVRFYAMGSDGTLELLEPDFAGSFDNLNVLDSLDQVEVLNAVAQDWGFKRYTNGFLKEVEGPAGASDNVHAILRKLAGLAGVEFKIAHIPVPLKNL